MNRLLAACALAFLCGPLSAGGTGGGGGSPGGNVPAGAGDDSYWSDGQGGISHLDVTQDPNPQNGVLTTVTDATGFSSAVPAIEGEGETAWSSDKMTTRGGEEYRVRGGALYKKGSDGKWHKLKKVKKPKTKSQCKSQSGGSMRLLALVTVSAP